MSKEREQKEVYAQELEARDKALKEQEAEFDTANALKETHNAVLNKTIASLVASVKYSILFKNS